MITVYETLPNLVTWAGNYCAYSCDYLSQKEFDELIEKEKQRGGLTENKLPFLKYVFKHVALDNIKCTDPIAKGIISYASFEYCIIKDCDFSEVEFNDAIFNFCDIQNCLFSGNGKENYIEMHLCNLKNNNFSNQILTGSFDSCQLIMNQFIGTDLSQCKLFFQSKITDNKIETGSALYYPTACPKEGEFIGWKKAYTYVYTCFQPYDRLTRRISGIYIVKLLIPSDAKRSSAFSNKCRCSKAKVLEIQNLGGSKTDVNEVWSNVSDTSYKIGEWVYPDSFDENRFNECSTGIHFFMNREDAVRY